MSTVFLPGDARSPAVTRESHAKPAETAAAAQVNGALNITPNAPKPVSKAHKAYQTEKDREKDSKTKAKDLIKGKQVIGRADQTVSDILHLMKSHQMEFIAILDSDDVLKGVFEKSSFYEAAFKETYPQGELLQMQVSNFLTVARTSADMEADIITLVRQLATNPNPWLPLYELEKSRFYGLVTHHDLILFLDQSRSLDIWI